MPTQEEYVTEGKFFANLPKIISSVSLYLDDEVKYENQTVSYRDTYHATFEQITLGYASVTPEPKPDPIYTIKGIIVDRDQNIYKTK